MKKITAFSAVLLSVLVFSVLPSCQSSKSSTVSRMLRFNFQHGKGYDYETNMTMNQEIMGMQMKMEINSYYSMDVSGEQDQSKWVVTRFDRLRMKTNMAGKEIISDSDKKGQGNPEDPNGTMNKLFGALAGRSFVMKVNAEGKIEEVRGLPEMAESLADSLGLEGSERKKLMAAFTNTFNENKMKDNFGRFLYIFPDKEVKVGDTWDKSSAVSGPFTSIYASSYTVKEIEGDMVTLEEKTKIRGTPSKENYDMSGSVTGILVVDSKTGLVVNADQDYTIKLEKAGQQLLFSGKSKVKGKAR